MSTIKLPFKRFVRQVSAGQALSKYGYISIMESNGEALKSADWKEAKAATGSLTVNQLTKTDGKTDDSGQYTQLPTFTVYLDSKYDAFVQAGDAVSKMGTLCGYAGMVAYRFTLPTTNPGAITSFKVGIQRDRYLRAGVRVAAQLSDSAEPSGDWSVIRGEASGSIVSPSTAPGEGVTGVTSFGFLGQTYTPYLLAGRAALGEITFDAETFPALSTAANFTYLWVYISPEDFAAYWDMYNEDEARHYYIEGSAALVPASTDFTFSTAAVSPASADVFKVLQGRQSPTAFEDDATIPVFQVSRMFNGDPIKAEGDIGYVIRQTIATGTLNTVEVLPPVKCYDSSGNDLGDVQFLAILGKSVSPSYFYNQNFWGLALYDLTNGRFVRPSNNGWNGADRATRGTWESAQSFTGWQHVSVENVGYKLWLCAIGKNNGTPVLSNESAFASSGTYAEVFYYNPQTGYATLSQDDTINLGPSRRPVDLRCCVGASGYAMTIGVTDPSDAYVTTPLGSPGRICRLVNGSIDDIAAMPDGGLMLFSSASGGTVHGDSNSGKGTVVYSDGTHSNALCTAMSAAPSFTAALPSFASGNKGLVLTRSSGSAVIVHSSGQMNDLGIEGCRSVCLAGEADSYCISSEGKAVQMTPVAVDVTLTIDKSAAGLRAASGMFYTGRFSQVPADGKMALGFSVNRSTYVRLAGGLVSLDCWQVVGSALVVPFRVPQAFQARQVALDWTADASLLPSGTVGSRNVVGRVHVYLVRNSFATSCPSFVSTAAAWEGSTCNGAELLGSFDMHANLATTVSFDIPGGLTGAAATLVLVPALPYIDEYNPASGDDGSILDGFGGLAYNCATGEASGVGDGIIPDITLS